MRNVVQQKSLANESAPPRARPAASMPVPILGNQARLRQLSAPRLQAKLEIGAVDDPLEREADAVADKVMRMPDAERAAQTSPVQVGRKCDECEKEDKATLRTKRAEQAARREAPAGVHEALGSPGQPLDASVRAFFEPRFGRDFSQVRVHTDSEAAQTNRQLDAQAFTFGSHIFYAAGKTPAADVLTGHELTHIVQQTGADRLHYDAVVRRQQDVAQNQNGAGAPAAQPPSAPSGPTAPPAMAVISPAVQGGSFSLQVTTPQSVDGPTMGFLGVYKVMPFDAEMDFTANASLRFPSGGTWEVGFVQNVEVVRFEAIYNSGGKLSFFVGVPLLDQNPDTKDIFVGDPQTIRNVTAGQTETINFTESDTPTTPPIAGVRQRCNNSISESPVSAVNSVFFRLALVARQGSSIFQLAASQQYGFTWAFTVNSNGVADSPPQFDFLPKDEKLNMKVPPFAPLQVAPPVVSDFVQTATSQAKLKYEQDCTKT